MEITFITKVELLAIFALASLLAFFLCPHFIRLAIAHNIVDCPDNLRKLHGRITPYLGGGVLYVALLAGIISSMTAWKQTHLWVPLAGLTVLFLLGLVDDIKGLGAGIKLPFQVFAVALLVLSATSGLSQAGWSSITPGFLIYTACLIVVGVLMVNAFNLIDGMDGLALGLGVIYMVPFMLAAVTSANQASLIIAITFIAASVGLVRHNFHPARIFLGDAGSLTIGGTVFLLLLLQINPDMDSGISNLGGVATPMLSLPLIDVVAVMAHRFLIGKPIMQADRNHIHHKLQRLGLDHATTVATLHSVAFVIMLLGVVTENFGWGLAGRIGILVFWISLYSLITLVSNRDIKLQFSSKGASNV